MTKVPQSQWRTHVKQNKLQTQTTDGCGEGNAENAYGKLCEMHCCSRWVGISMVIRSVHVLLFFHRFFYVFLPRCLRRSVRDVRFAKTSNSIRLSSEKKCLRFSPKQKTILRRQQREATDIDTVILSKTKKKNISKPTKIHGIGLEYKILCIGSSFVISSMFLCVVLMSVFYTSNM